MTFLWTNLCVQFITTTIVHLELAQNITCILKPEYSFGGFE